MIKQPNVILGNDDLLVTMSKMGEILGFFYPRRDHAVSIQEKNSSGQTIMIGTPSRII